MRDASDHYEDGDWRKTQSIKKEEFDLLQQLSWTE